MNLRTRCMLSVAMLAAMPLVSNGVLAQQRSTQKPVPAPRGMVQDWSNDALIFSQPLTPEEAARQGQTAKWRRDYQDPRYVLALMKRMEAQSDAAYAKGLRKPTPPPPPPPGSGSSMHRDWSNTMGGAGGTGADGIYPAKYSFNINAPPSCTGDFVVYTTNAPGATDSGIHNAYSDSFGTGNVDDAGRQITIGTGVRSVTLTVVTSPTASPLEVHLPTGSGQGSTKGSNMRLAINRWSGVTGVTATGTLGTAGFLANSAGAGTISIVENINGNGWDPAQTAAGTGTGGQPTVVAFNQLYKGDPLLGGCGLVTGQEVYKPTVMWSYNTGTGAVARTSPVISYLDNGQQVAFIQSSSGNVAQLVLLKPSSASPGTTGVPTAPTSVTPANYRTCTAPCMTVMSFGNGANNLISSPFVDYFGDVLWVGDSTGRLHKFTGVFAGTPAEVTTGGFPAVVSDTNALGAPVYSGGSVFVGSASGAATGGSLHKVNASTGVSAASARLAANNSPGVRATPKLDGSVNRAYAFIGADRTTACLGGTPCHAVIQFDTANIVDTVTTGSAVQVGIGSATDVQWTGAWGNDYLTAPGPNGHMYVCGTSAATANRTTLWKIQILNNVMQAPQEGATVSNGAAPCSPVGRVKNGLTNEYLFFSVSANGNATGCVGACVYMFNLANLDGANGTTWGTGNTARAGLAATSGTGAIVIDNVSATAGSSQIYFANRSSPGNAIQVGQANLQ